jgi:serine phosphatase RsbU (regulator of sigma subunit)
VRAGVAFDNATLYADRDTVARTLLDCLIPGALPDVPGAEVVALHKEGRSSLGLGGDFYDGVALGEDRWMLAVGDVCGKGVEAAALTGAVRYAVRTAAILTESPAQVLRIVNDALLREAWTGRFATLVLARLDRTSTGFRLTVSAAGHPAPLVRRTGGTVEGVDVEGTLVGLLAEAQFGETVVDLADGDCVLLFTDGLTEAGAPGEMFGDERLAAALAAADPSSAERLARDVLARVEAFATGTRSAERDDMAVLVVRVG